MGVYGFAPPGCTWALFSSVPKSKLLWPSASIFQLPTWPIRRHASPVSAQVPAVLASIFTPFSTYPVAPLGPPSVVAVVVAFGSIA